MRAGTPKAIKEVCTYSAWGRLLIRSCLVHKIALAAIQLWKKSWARKRAHFLLLGCPVYCRVPSLPGSLVVLPVCWEVVMTDWRWIFGGFVLAIISYF